MYKVKRIVYRVEFPFLCYGNTYFYFNSMIDACDFVDMVWDCCVADEKKDKEARIQKIVVKEEEE